MTRRLEIPDNELSFDFSTSGGPGGQNVNKVATKVRLTFDISSSSVFTLAEKSLITASPHIKPYLAGEGVIAIVSQRSRSQLQNREDALAKLLEVLSLALVRPKKRRPTRATKSSKERRLKTKRERGDRKSNRRRPSTD